MGLAPIEAPPEKEKEAERTKRGAREDGRWERDRERDRDCEDRESRRGWGMGSSEFSPVFSQARSNRKS